MWTVRLCLDKSFRREGSPWLGAGGRFSSEFGRSHVGVIEANLYGEVGLLRDSDYTSEFIHHTNSSAPEVTRTEHFLETRRRARARASTFLVESACCVARQAYTEARCTRPVYGSEHYRTPATRTGEEAKRRGGERGKEKRKRGTRMRSWRRIAACRTTERAARRTVSPWRTPRFSCPEDGLLSKEQAVRETSNARFLHDHSAGYDRDCSTSSRRLATVSARLCSWRKRCLRYSINVSRRFCLLRILPISCLSHYRFSLPVTNHSFPPGRVGTDFWRGESPIEFILRLLVAFPSLAAAPFIAESWRNVSRASSIERKKWNCTVSTFTSHYIRQMMSAAWQIWLIINVLYYLIERSGHMDERDARRAPTLSFPIIECFVACGCVAVSSRIRTERQ